MNSILVTGGSGAFGTAFAKKLLSEGWDRIILFSRSEFRQFQVATELRPYDPDSRLRFFIGDVRDRDRLRRAMKDVAVVVHAAALKRIEVGAYNPIEMVKTNVDGAVNVIEAAQDAYVHKVVGLSTDKAYQPVSPYGYSKAMAESLFLTANNITGGSPRFAVTRYGNVWGSTGSVVPLWKAHLSGANEKIVPVTDPDCTRFFMTMDEALTLVLETIWTMHGGELRIPTLPAYRLGDLAEAMGAKMKITGLPPWEKKHESMCAGNSSDQARRMSVDELREILRS